MMTYNTAGFRMQKRRPRGRALTGTWGTGTDGMARPTDEAQRILKRMQEGDADVAVLTDTHLEGDELTAMRGHLRGQGWGSAGEEAEEGIGGVLVIWREATMSKVAGPVRNEGAPGRMVKVALRELGSGRRMEVIGVYATCRGAQMEMERRVWKKLDEWVWKGTQT